MRIFIDSDVLISSFLSRRGAAYLIIDTLRMDKFISNFSLVEIETAFIRKSLDLKALEKLVKQKIKVVEIDEEEVKSKNKFVVDPNDAHIIAGAIRSKARFLISYNIRDYLVDKIYQNLNIIVMTPGQFLQYLRAISTS